jgi:ABC-type multidrug transport system fused ATPase/permease subunit
MNKKFLELYNILDQKRKLKLLQLFILTIFLIPLEIISIGSIGPFIAVISAPDFIINNYLKNYLNFDFNSKNLIIYGSLIFLFIFSLRTILNAMFTWKIIEVNQSFSIFISEKLLSYYTNLNYLEFKKNNRSIMMRNVLNECFNIGGLFPNIISYITEIIILIIIIVFLFTVNFKITFGVIFFSTLIGLIYVSFIRKKIKLWGAERFNVEGERFKSTNKIFNLFKDLVLYQKINEFYKTYVINNERFVKLNIYSTFLNQGPRLFLEFFAILALVILIFTFVLNDYSNTKIILYLGVYLGAFYRLIPSYYKLINAIQSFNFSIKVFDSLKNELQIIKQKNSNPKNLKIINDVDFKKITFEKISLSFDKKEIFKEISLKLSLDKIYGITGNSGSGKTTFVDLISGLIDCSSGKIYLDDYPLEEAKGDWQKMISYISPNTYIFDGTIYENITFEQFDKNNHEKNQKVTNALKKANLYDFIQGFENSLAHKINDYGSNFSEGQKQRLSLARAFYKNSKVIILDEATNFLDKKTQKIIIEELISTYKGTIFIISHDKEVFKLVDYILEIQDENISLLEKANF